MLIRMNTKQKEQLLQFQTLGLNIGKLTYEQCVDILIEKYLGLVDELELTEKQRFQREIRRIQHLNN